MSEEQDKEDVALISELETLARSEFEEMMQSDYSFDPYIPFIEVLENMFVAGFMTGVMLEEYAKEEDDSKTN